MKRWLIKIIFISLALFFTYTYVYQHVEKKAQPAQSAVSQLTAEPQTAQAASHSVPVTAPDAAELWKTDTQEKQGVLPQVTHAIGAGASAIIQQGVVLLASLVNVFMHIFL